MSAATGRSASRSLHSVGVVSGLAAGAWLGLAEAPTKLVTVGFSPFVISLGMVMGVFVARWTVPVALKGTSYVWADLRFYTRLKTVTARWPGGNRGGSEFVMPTMK